MKSKHWLTAAFTLIGLLAAPSAFAEPVTVAGHVVGLRTGWNADSFAIITDTPISNPFGCLSPDGYIMDKSMPGYDTLYAAAKLAFEQQYSVEVVFDGAKCFVNRPILIGVNLYK